MSTTAIDFAILESFIAKAAKDGTPENEWKLALLSLKILAGQRGTDVALGRRSGLEQAAKIAKKWADYYPSDIFLPGGESLDARSAAHGRHVAAGIEKDIREAARRPS